MTALRDLPLSALRAFAAVARAGSLSGAAERLGVTPGAVSHQIRHLEDRLGVKLVTRAGNGVQVTRAAERALPDIDRGFEALRQGMQRLRTESLHQSFTVAADPSFAALWLAPRLPALRAAVEGLEVRIVAPVPLGAMLDEAVDLSISYSADIPAGLETVAFPPERIVPACAPDLLEGIANTRAPGVMRRLPLLHIDPSMGDNVYPGWRDWFAAAGFPAAEADRGVHFGLGLVAAQAAITGQGVLLASEAVLESHLGAGALVEIAGDGPRLSFQRRLVWPGRGPRAAQSAAVADLLAHAAGR
ncbi:LysR family transcriptional regulator [Rhodovulum sp. YNF3179]|uniref:LysR family transcriptional regulator n=1 Tax=Rhodovulum sp. YNF3179 TaxID=3425127 RepID=UPI003D358B3D